MSTEGRRGAWVSRVLLASVLAALLASVVAASASGDVVWLCKPGLDPNPCRGSMQTTIQSADGPDQHTNPAPPSDPPIDCFYVYPTVSDQPTFNANKDKDPEIVAIAEYQAARYSLKCRVYAPVYRQLTLLSIQAATPAQRADGFKIAYSDVKEAWNEYLAHYNDGRGVVLIGHSQGTRMLRQLTHDEIDPKPDVRRRIVSALLFGGNVLVKKGQKVGGDFQHLPACTSDTQTGCVVAWSTFNAPPPANSRFGRSPTTDPGFGMPWGPDYEVLCTNPASLGANDRVPLHTLLRSEPFPGVIEPLLLLMYGGPPPFALTPWVVPADRYTGRCEQSAGANVLMLQPIGNAHKLNPSPDATWGLHLSDANIALDDLVALVGRQAQAYLATASVGAVRTIARRVRLRIAYRRGRSVAGRACARSALRITIAGAGAASVRLMSVRLNGRRVVVDSRRPFVAHIPRARLRRASRNRIAVTLLRAGVPTTRLTRVVRAC